MRHIIFTSILLGVPLAAVAQDEAQGTQSQSGQEQQQTQGQDPTLQQTQGQDAATQQTQDAAQTQEQDATLQQTQGQDAATQQTEDAMAQQQTGETEAEAEAARAQFTSNVQDREPVDEVSEYEVTGEPLYFFTEIENGAGQTITHRWLHEGEVQAEVPLEVGSDSWRTWSSKELTPELEGEWTVEVVDAQGNTLTEESITVEATGAQTENVGYSPEDETATEDQTGAMETEDQTGTMEETATQDDAAETEETGMETQDEGMQSDALPEEVEYEEESATQAQDPMQDEDAQDDDRTGEDY